MPETAVDLYRSVRSEQFPEGTLIKNEPAPHLLEPDFYARKLDSGDIRNPDVVLFVDKNKVEWVRSGGGTSLFDRANVFKGANWLSFQIPQGTIIPDSLKVVKESFNKKFKATHYQIESSAETMTKVAMQGALDNFARNAIVKTIELAK